MQHAAPLRLNDTHFMSIFEMVSPTNLGTPPVPGPWASQPPPSPMPEGLSFSTLGGGEEMAPIEVPTWRANLPADLNEAAVQIALGEASVRASQRALANAPTRLDAALKRRPNGFSFSTNERRPEDQLFGMLGALEEEPNAVNFGIGEDVKAGWEKANAQFRSFAAQAREAITNLAVVETRSGNLLIGRTSVNWSGDMRTLWPIALEPAQTALHQRTLTLALESRLAMVRTFILVLRGAGLVAQAVSSPIGTVTAIPAAWKFISEILNEVKDERRRTKDEGNSRSIIYCI
jgi:hypothetical protein